MPVVQPVLGTVTNTYIKGGRWRDGRDRQTGRQTDRQTDRERERLID